MKTRNLWQGVKLVASLTILAVCITVIGNAQQNAGVPTLVNFSGTLTDVNGKPLGGTVGVTFYLYKDQQGGAPLWMETQNVQPDKNGHYSVQLGATTSQGLPTDLFASGEARWLGVQAEGQLEQPRVLLSSVPYALKAADAQTIGGLPPSAFVLSKPGGSQTSATSVVETSMSAGSPNVGGTGTQNYIPIWTDNNGDLGNSAFYQLGSGSTAKIGLNFKNPLATLDVNGTELVRGLLETAAIGFATPTKGFNSNPMNLEASSYNSSTAKALLHHFQWQAEPTGNNTTNPSATLNLLFGTEPNLPAETGVNISSTGIFTFAPGQTFPGTGTITGVTAGTDLTGGGNTGNVTLNLDTNATDARYAQLNSTNVFTQFQSIEAGLNVYSGIYATASCLGCLVGVEGVSNIGVWGFSNADGGEGLLGEATTSGSAAGTFIKLTGTPPGTRAAVQAMNADTVGESGWFGLGNSTNTNSVIKVVLPSGSNANFLECDIPDGIRKCHITTGGTFVSGSDFAEALPAHGGRALYEPGDVLVMSTDGKGVQKTTQRYSQRIVGVYSTHPAVLGAEKGGETRVDPEDIPVAITGIVPTKVTADNGPVLVGDLLVTSAKPGYAMKANIRGQLAGAVLGKALESLQSGTGIVKVLIMLK